MTTTYHDGIYSAQDAVRSYLTENLVTYASGVAGSLPVIVAGEFADRGRDHIYVLCDRMTSMPDLTGGFEATIKVGVITTRDTSLNQHREYCRATFDLLHEEDITTYLNETDSGIGFYQVSAHEQEAGVLTDALRYAQTSFTSLVYMTGEDITSSSSSSSSSGD